MMVKWISALTLVVCMASTSALCAQEITKPLGKWQRKVGKTNVTLNVENNRLHILCTGDKAITLHADYAMTHDGLIYGVVTSIECDEDDEAETTKTLFDAPFSFRFRIDEGALIIHDMKAHDADSKDDMWNGRYKIVRPATTRDAIVPTSGTIPSSYSFPFNTPATSPSNNSSSLSTTGAQTFNYWMGFSR
jgi:hypothetical protein